ncbi:hypothetical protein [Terriglobus albidus]|uniref:hypothetical protein n=1 Tax=Terriglobus albidus TaxID=1592106 RepID=UPI0021E06FB5|nr:hypothetical protein [Terriglobus albidus]
MNHADQSTRYEELRGRLTALRFLFSTNPEAEQARAYFDENIREYEFEIAMHALCDYLFEVRRPISSDVLAEIGKLHALMGVDDDCVSRMSAIV